VKKAQGVPSFSFIRFNLCERETLFLGDGNRPEHDELRNLLTNFFNRNRPFKITVISAESAKLSTSGVYISVQRDACVKILFDLDRDAPSVVVCSRRRLMEAWAARYKHRHSSFTPVLILLSARARARVDRASGATGRRSPAYAFVKGRGVRVFAARTF